MPEQDSQHFPLKVAYHFLESNRHSNEASSIRESTAKLGSYDHTLKKAMALATLTQCHLLERFIVERWPYGGTPEGQKELKRLQKLYERYQKSIGATTELETVPDENEPAQGTAFAYEEHLRDYLAQHLELLEEGLKPWRVGDEDAVEFPVNGRRIDILAKDKQDLPVVIELKVSRGHERTIGQALYYRAKVKEILKVAKVRIFIVALEMSPELRAAAKEVPDVFLFEYSLSMSIKPI
jgi:Endonuclease NucS